MTVDVIFWLLYLLGPSIRCRNQVCIAVACSVLCRTPLQGSSLYKVGPVGPLQAVVLLSDPSSGSCETCP